jgi:hypothetical protein
MHNRSFSGQLLLIKITFVNLIHFFMTIKKHLLLFLILSLNSFGVFAQFDAVIVNLNNKEQSKLSLGDVFYFGTNLNHEKYKGTLEKVDSNEIVISGKAYKINEISWIDYKGNRPKKNTSQIARILLYFGGGAVVMGAYKFYEDTDKTNAQIIMGAGGAVTLAAIFFWIIPKQPKYDFSTKYLLETIPQTQVTK